MNKNQIRMHENLMTIVDRLVEFIYRRKKKIGHRFHLGVTCIVDLMGIITMLKAVVTLL